MLAGPRFLEACRRRYGNAVTFSTVFDSSFVMVFDPALAKQLFQGSNDQLHAGEANALLGPILGERSVLLLDGAEHLRHRRLMLPPFHGRRMQAYAEVMRDAADAEIDSWPVGEPFALLPSMQSLTLRVILRAVFGYEPGPAEDGAAPAAAGDGRAARPAARAAADAVSGGSAARSRRGAAVRGAAAARSTRSCTPRSPAAARSPDLDAARRRVLGAAAGRGRGGRDG